MMKNCISTLGFAALLMMTTPTHAGIVYDNGGPGQGGVISEPEGFNFAGSIFTLEVTRTLRDVHWYGFYADGNSPTTPDNFRIQLFNVSLGTPSTTAFYTANVGDVGRTDTGLNFFQFDIFIYSAFIPEIVLPTGEYLLSIVNDTIDDIDDIWLWSINTDQAELGYFRIFESGPGSNWIQGVPDFAYFLTDDVRIPEPGTLALFGLGLVGLVYARRQRVA